MEIPDLATPTRAVFANPDNTFTAKLSVVPTRVKRGHSWVAVDTTIVPRAGGMVAPKAAVGDLSLSGGGTDAPLVRMVKDGKSFALYWSGTLPAPKLDGPTATYAEVLPGVDLTMRATANGYQLQLVVTAAGAARNPALAQIPFRVETAGVRLTADESGVVRAVDSGGEPIFVAPPSMMWDSSGPAPHSPATARSARVGVAIQGGSLVLRPDVAFLADPALVFPVVIDPDMRTWDKSNWATVLSGKPTDSYWWTSGAGPGVAQVGQCYNGNGDCNGIGAARAYFQYDTSFVNGRRIIGSVLNSVVTHSPDCGSHAHQLWRTDGQIHPGTNWNNAPPGVSGTDFLVPPRHGCTRSRRG